MCQLAREANQKAQCQVSELNYSFSTSGASKWPDVRREKINTQEACIKPHNVAAIPLLLGIWDLCQKKDSSHSELEWG